MDKEFLEWKGGPFLRFGDELVAPHGRWETLVRYKEAERPQPGGLQEVVDESLELRMRQDLAGVSILEHGALAGRIQEGGQSAGALPRSSLQERLEGYQKYTAASVDADNAMPNIIIPSTGIGAMGGLIGGFAYGLHLWGWENNPEATGGRVLSLLFMGIVIGITALGLPAYFIGKSQEREARKQLEEAKLKWQPVKEVHPGEIVTVNTTNDAGGSKGYLMGLVKEVTSNGLIALSKYFEASGETQSYTLRTRKFSLDKVVAVLEPDSAPLTPEQLRQTPCGSALACLSSQGSLAFGFLGKKDIKGVSLYADHECRNLSGKFPYEEMQTQELRTYALTPLPLSA